CRAIRPASQPSRRSSTRSRRSRTARAERLANEKSVGTPGPRPGVFSEERRLPGRRPLLCLAPRGDGAEPFVELDLHGRGRAVPGLPRTRRRALTPPYTNNVPNIPD